MLITLFKRKRNKSDVETAPSKYAQAKSGKELLESPKRSTLIRKIKRLFSITEDVWNNHYLFAIERFAELVQEVPASEIHHHSKEGGLIDHTLEALYAGIRIAQGYVLPPNSEPEHIASSSDRWRFGAFIAILTHDIGKVVTDIEIVYRERGGEFEHWHPWYGSIPTGAEYSYRYKKRISNSKIAKSLHEKAAMSLLPRLLTKKAAQWIFEDTELLAQLFNTVSHSTFGGQAIAEIVRVADSASVAKNLGAETGMKTDHSTAIPLHEKLIVSLRKLITDGDLKRNKPGAAVWVTDSDTWVVSKATMEAVRVQLLNEGHRGIPQNVVRLFEVLNDHDLLIKNSYGESVWTAEINDFAKNWQQKLTFLRFKNEIIWPTSNPETFDGEVLPVDKSGNIIEGTQTPGDLNVIEKSAKSYFNKSTDKGITNTLKSKPKKTTLPDSVLLKHDKQNAIDALKDKGETKKHIDNAPAERTHERDPMPKKTLSEDKGQNGISSHEAKNLKNISKKIQKELITQNDFLTWLLKGISRRQIRVNESKAPVHILDSHVALVTPVIFNLFLDKNSLKKRLYEKRAGDKKVYTLLQKELESLDIHQRSSSGQNIVRMTVEGQRSQSELRVYLLNRDYFPSLSNFSTNKAMTINM
ncbi:MobH family relaxase [Microbulbifer sp. THAF38]|uniref:MobH family relaxase n=1 Tax=Microbulbifer sp. THAF38 TaxID=2587856 RepID=UPI001268E5D3|nr:MobH family relaxase [Microbulbifer sp. THAF38]QFT57159.1 Putative helicase [Microbulbifer sp. THAF38]